MKENAILIRQLDVLKVYVDFSSDEGIKTAINAERLSTIHTLKTQELSNKLGVHLIGYINREGNDINNDLACEISGYDYIGSFMLLCKSDDKYNNYGFDENELECVYTYLTTGKVISPVKDDTINKFFKKYSFEAPLPNFDIKPKVYYDEKVPYVILLRYEIRNVPFHLLERMGQVLFSYSTTLLDKCVTIENGVNLSKDDKYYIKCLTKDGYFNILIQAKEDENNIIGHIETMIDAYLGNVSIKKDYESEDLDTSMEEALDID